MMRILIADDEAPARSRLRQMLASHTDVEVAGEAENGIQTMELARELKPDLILLDIQMPGCGGIDVAACLPHPRPHIIFCTAFDQHAVDAFELHAIDYLLKPISRARLTQALDRVRSTSTTGAEPSLDQIERHQVGRHQHLRPAHFLVRSSSGYLVLNESRVQYFVSEDGLTRLVGDGGQYWIDPTLNELEQRLDPARYFRISRSALVSLSAVSEVIPMPGGSGEVLLKNGQRLEVSRRRFRDFLQSLQGNY